MYVLNKGVVHHVIVHAIDRGVAIHSAQKGTYFLKSVIINCRHSDFDYLLAAESRNKYKSAQMAVLC